MYNTCKCSQLYAVHHNDTVNAELNSGRYSKAYVEMNLGMHDRLSEISFRETKIIFKNIFPYENMFQGPKGYVEQMCEVTCSIETVQQNGGFTLFSTYFHSILYRLGMLLYTFLRGRQ